LSTRLSEKVNKFMSFYVIFAFQGYEIGYFCVILPRNTKSL